MSHAELVLIAEKWLAKTKRCGVVVTEYRCQNGSGESPDALGFRSNESYLVECKVSKADFEADKRKRFRQHYQEGHGLYRYYLTTPGLLKESELGVHGMLGNWGLLESDGGRVRVIREARIQPDVTRINANDRSVLYSVARRAVIRGFDTNSKLGDTE